MIKVILITGIACLIGATINYWLYFSGVSTRPILSIAFGTLDLIVGFLDIKLAVISK